MFTKRGSNYTWFKLHYTQYPSAQMYQLYSLKTFFFGHICSYLAIFTVFAHTLKYAAQPH